MQKAGEKAKAFATHGVFIVIVILGLYFIATHAPSITGHAVLDASTAKSKLESALSSSALMGQLTQSSICVIINDPEQPLSLQATKTSSGWTVAEMKGMCAGQTSEDLIVQFPDYDSFSNIADNPSPRNLANAAMSREFEILPSRYVELGGNVVCDAAFKVKYCGALTTTASPEQLIDGDLSCCLDKMTKAQKKILEQHLLEGTYEDEIGILQQPSGVAGMSMTTSIIALAVIVLVVIFVIVGVMMHGKGSPKPSAKPASRPAPGAVPGSQGMQGSAGTGMGMPGMGLSGMGMPAAAMATPAAVSIPTQDQQISELKEYVTGVLVEGYDPEEVRSHLLEIGWDSDTAERVLQEAYAAAQQRLEQQ